MRVPTSHESAAQKNRDGQRSFDEVHAQKRAAALKNPQADRNAENAEAKKPWSKGNE